MKIEKQNKTLHIVDRDSDMPSLIQNIAEEQENAFYVCNLDRIVHNFKIFKKQLPRIQPFYSVKCNDNVTVLEILNGLGTGFNCASKSEIHKILSLDVDANKINFANPAKIAKQIHYAAGVGVNLMVFDNEVELRKIKEHHPNSKLLVRICNDTEKDSFGFGCDATEVPNLLLVAQSLGLNVIGVSIQFNDMDLKSLQKLLGTVRNIFDFAATLGFDFNTLDFADGFPIEDFEAIASTMSSALEVFFPQKFITVTADVSRFLVTAAFTLACSVNFIRPVPSEAEMHYMYVINESVYSNFGSVLTNNQVLKLKPLKETSNDVCLYLSSILGSICDHLDTITEGILLPVLEVGDWILFENMGAYTLSLNNNFNGFPSTKIHFVASEDIWLRLKALLPLMEERLENENIPRDFNRADVDKNWSLPSLPITMKIPRFGDLFEEHVLDFVTACSIE